MYIKVLAVVLFTALIYIPFNGILHFDKYESPLILLIVSIGIGLLYFLQEFRSGQAPSVVTQALKPGFRILWFLGGVAAMALAYEELRKLFVSVDPYQMSDVLAQLETMYQRFRQGEFPYTPVHLPTHTTFPVYMPLHWLPIGVADWIGMDTRWIGYIFLVLANGFYGIWVGGHKSPLLLRFLVLFLPSMGLWGFILWGGIELPVSLETLIAAYYLLLAVGLLKSNLALITIGILTCLLSRYTLIFWLPLFAWILYRERPFRQSLLVWGFVVSGILVLYILPFILKDPTIPAQSLAYHNGCAIAEWTGYGEPPVSWSLEGGYYLAVFMKNNFSGDMEHRVFLARMLQASVMLMLLAFGLFAYYRWRHLLHSFALCLVMLYLTIILFYLFSPQTFKYYYLVPFVLAAVVVARIVLAPHTSLSPATASPRSGSGPD